MEKAVLGVGMDPRIKSGGDSGDGDTLCEPS